MACMSLHLQTCLLSNRTSSRNLRPFKQDSACGLWGRASGNHMLHVLVGIFPSRQWVSDTLAHRPQYLYTNEMDGTGERLAPWLEKRGIADNLDVRRRQETDYDAAPWHHTWPPEMTAGSRGTAACTFWRFRPSRVLNARSSAAQPE